MITDTDRLDWLEKHKEGIVTVWETKRQYTTQTHPTIEVKDIFLGWSTSGRTDELPTIREAIDAAIEDGEVK